MIRFSLLSLSLALALLALCPTISATPTTEDTFPCAHGLGPCTAASPVPHRHAFPASRRAAIDTVLGPAYAAISANKAAPAHGAASGTGLRVFRPVDFGADPSGKTDSTDAVLKAVAALLASSNDSLTLSATTAAAATYVDLRGALLDLTGGNYLISKGIVVPPGQIRVIPAGSLGPHTHTHTHTLYHWRRPPNKAIPSHRSSQMLPLSPTHTHTHTARRPLCPAKATPTFTFRAGCCRPAAAFPPTAPSSASEA